jgi:hypothetical protein
VIELSLVHSPAAESGPHEQVCTFCLRVLAAIDLLVRGPEVSICSHCVDVCVTALRRHRVRGFRAWWDPRPRVRDHRAPSAGYRSSTAACSFCLKPEGDELLVAEHGRICATCIRLCLDVFAQHRARKQ